MSKGGAPKGNKNALRHPRPPQPRLDCYAIQLAHRKVTRAALARKLRVGVQTLYRWIPGMGLNKPKRLPASNTIQPARLSEAQKRAQALADLRAELQRPFFESGARR